MRTQAQSLTHMYISMLQEQNTDLILNKKKDEARMQAMPSIKTLRKKKKLTKLSII